MPRVLHVGPCNARGGMATVMRTLAEHPPEGWSAELLPTYSAGGIWAKWRAYRRAKMELKRRCTSQEACPDIVHVHVASDWSWRRKAQFIQQAQQYSMAVVIHLHSGAFEKFLGNHPRQRTRLTQLTNVASTVTVVLSDHWRDRFTSCVSDLRVVPNPMPENVGLHLGERDAEHLLLLGRPDPVKGHDFAVNLLSVMRQSRPQLRLSMTGVENIEVDGVAALGWVAEEEKTRLLRTCSALLVPSSFEGQPMVVIEALASGCPVVVSSTVPSPPEAVTVAQHADQGAWVRAVNEVLGRPIDAQRLALSVDAHRIERVQQTWASVYSQALTSRTKEA